MCVRVYVCVGGGRLSWGFCQSAKSLCNTVANPSIRSAKSTLSQQPFTSPACPSASHMVSKKITVQKDQFFNLAS